MTDLLIGGMTCAACVARVEKKLNRLDGVSATVNLATGLARIAHPPEVSADMLVSTVERAGYTASYRCRPPAAGGASPATRRRSGPTEPRTAADHRAARGARSWCCRWSRPCSSTTGSGCASRSPRRSPSGAPGPSTPGRCGACGMPTATMDTLVSLGVVASFPWSVYALFFGGAGEPGMRMPFSLLPARGGRHRACLSGGGGRRPAVRAHRAATWRRAPGAAPGRRCGRWPNSPPRTWTLTGGGSRSAASRSSELRAGQEFLVRPGERVATDGVVTEGSSALDLSLVTGESDAGRGGARLPAWSAGPSTPAGCSSSAPPPSAPTPNWPASPGW